MRKVPAVTRAAAAAALAALPAAGAAGCGAGTNTHSSERITATPAASPSSARSSAPGAGPSRQPRVTTTCEGAGPGGRSGPVGRVSTVRVEDSGVAAAVSALDAVQFVSDSRGWAAGAGRILATGDGGATWTAQYAGPARIFSLDFTDADHGWAVGTSALLATSDGGRNWTSLPEPCGLIDSVHFVTPRLGYAVAGGSAVELDAGTPVALSASAGASDGGRLLVTKDGGHTWNAVAGAPAQVQSACFTSSSAGFLGTPGRVWRTTDGGAHWSASFTEPPATGSGAAQPGTPGDATALECAGGAAAWTLFIGSGAALGHAPYLAYATPDGRNWRVLFEESYIESAIRPGVHAPDGPGSYPGPFSAISADSAAYVGWTPPEGLGAAPLEAVSLGTGTGGTMLTREGNVAGVTRPYAAAFVTSARGWVVGADQTTPDKAGSDVIEHTANAGRTWTRQYAAP
jgi:Photosynthesis system II assembly factor YCF48